MTTTQQILNTPYYRAYSHLTKEFVPFGILTTGNDFFIKDPDGKSVKLEGIEIDIFLGRYCENGDPIYENDVVEVATLNEFGSATIDSGAIRYDTDRMLYYIESKEIEGGAHPLPTKILRVIGHAHG